jgi:hypothetical protein
MSVYGSRISYSISFLQWLNAQVAEDGEPGVALSRFGLESPTLQYSAVYVPEYSSTWGPAWSSQQTACPVCCSQQETCSPVGCSQSLIFLTQCESDPASFHIHGLVDGIDDTLYKAGCVDCGRQWFVVGFPEALYIQGVTMELGGMQGHIVSIKGAAVYQGNQTEWEDVWYTEGLQARPVPAGLVKFVPEMCRNQPNHMRWLRVEYDTANATAYPAFASVMVEGSLGPPASAVQNSEARLVYKALPGLVTAKRDSIEARASDCHTWSDPVKFNMTLPGLLVDDGSVFGEPQRVTVRINRRTEVRLDLTSAWEQRQRELAAVEAAKAEEAAAEVEAATDDQINSTTAYWEIGEILSVDDFEVRPPSDSLFIFALLYASISKFHLGMSHRRFIYVGRYFNADIIAGHFRCSHMTIDIRVFVIILHLCRVGGYSCRLCAYLQVVCSEI